MSCNDGSSSTTSNRACDPMVFRAFLRLGPTRPIPGVRSGAIRSDGDGKRMDQLWHGGWENLPGTWLKRLRRVDRQESHAGPAGHRPRWLVNSAVNACDEARSAP